jgi:Co/Zn/Cd efflux system component
MYNVSDVCCPSPIVKQDQSRAYRRVLWIVLGVNLAMFIVEMVVGLSAGSVALQADSLDFLGDTANYGVSLFVSGMALRNRSIAAFGKGVTMGLFGIWVLASSAWKAFGGVPPEAVTMCLVGFAALAANALCFALLSAYRSGDSNMRSVWLCSRNDLVGNCAVLAAAIGVARTGAAWPDVLVAALMAVLALQGAAVVVRQARAELTGAAA